jgi:LSD1 subclass zinc finger protein
MKCNNCGAPLTLVEGRDHYVCAYCATFHYPPRDEPDHDGLVALEQASDAQCPRCDAALAEGMLDSRRVAYCARCRGMLLSNDDFAFIIRKRRAEYTGPAVKPAPLDAAELKRWARCPGCGGRMDVHPYYGPGSVVIDSCGRCHLVWVDRAEIAAIERAPGSKW